MLFSFKEASLFNVIFPFQRARFTEALEQILHKSVLNSSISNSCTLLHVFNIQLVRNYLFKRPCSTWLYHICFAPSLFAPSVGGILFQFLWLPIHSGLQSWIHWTERQQKCIGLRCFLTSRSPFSSIARRWEYKLRYLLSKSHWKPLTRICDMWICSGCTITIVLSTDGNPESPLWKQLFSIPSNVFLGTFLLLVSFWTFHFTLPNYRSTSRSLLLIQQLHLWTIACIFAIG